MAKKSDYDSWQHSGCPWFAGTDYDEEDVATPVGAYAGAKMGNQKHPPPDATFGSGPETEDICANYPNPYGGNGSKRKY